MMWWKIGTALLVAALWHMSGAQQDFSTGEIPDPFMLGNRYPDREEEQVCRSISDHIERGSVRFTNELVTNTNSRINFETADSRVMTSRMQTRLDRVANLYSRSFTVQKAWTEFPDPDFPNNNRSLHFEGLYVLHCLWSVCVCVCVGGCGGGGGGGGGGVAYDILVDDWRCCVGDSGWWWSKILPLEVCIPWARNSWGGRGGNAWSSL